MVTAEGSEKRKFLTRGYWRVKWKQIGSEPAYPASTRQRAQWIKARLQMMVGVVMALVAIIFTFQAANTICGSIVAGLAQARTDDKLILIQNGIFGIVGIGLALGAAVELAYNFFTDGPDEALDPLLLSIAGAFIVQLGQDANRDGYTWGDGLASLALAGCIAIVFAVKERYLDGDDETEKGAEGTQAVTSEELTTLAPQQEEAAGPNHTN